MLRSSAPAWNSVKSKENEVLRSWIRQIDALKSFPTLLGIVLSAIATLADDVLAGKDETLAQLVSLDGGRMLIDAITESPREKFQDKEQMANHSMIYKLLHQIIQARFGQESILAADCEGAGIDGLWLRLNTLVKFAGAPGRLASDVLRCYDVAKHQVRNHSDAHTLPFSHFVDDNTACLSAFTFETSFLGCRARNN